MKIYRIGQAVWTVWGVLDDSDACPVLDFLLAYPNKELAAKVLAWLTDTVPQRGPKSLGKEKTRPIQSVEYIFEFRAIRRREPGLRVLWFYDTNKTIVCTHAFEKTDKAPPGVYKAAGRQRMLYLEAKSTGKLILET